MKKVMRIFIHARGEEYVIYTDATYHHIIQKKKAIQIDNIYVPFEYLLYYS